MPGHVNTMHQSDRSPVNKKRSRLKILRDEYAGGNTELARVLDEVIDLMTLEIEPKLYHFPKSLLHIPRRVPVSPRLRVIML